MARFRIPTVFLFCFTGFSTSHTSERLCYSSPTGESWTSWQKHSWTTRPWTLRTSGAGSFLLLHAILKTLKNLHLNFFFNLNRLMACSNHMNTGLVWYSNGRFVSSCQVVQYSNGQNWKSLFMVQNVRYLNGLLSHVTLPFEYRTPMLWGIQMLVTQMVTV